MKEIIWKRFKVWRFEFRTNNDGWWVGIDYKSKPDGPVYDLTFSKYGINLQKLPF